MSAEATNKIDRMVKMAREFEFRNADGELCAWINFETGDVVLHKNFITREEVYDFADWLGKLIY